MQQPRLWEISDSQTIPRLRSFYSVNVIHTVNAYYRGSTKRHNADSSWAQDLECITTQVFGFSCDMIWQTAQSIRTDDYCVRQHCPFSCTAYRLNESIRGAFCDPIMHRSSRPRISRAEWKKPCHLRLRRLPRWHQSVQARCRSCSACVCPQGQYQPRRQTLRPFLPM